MNLIEHLAQSDRLLWRFKDIEALGYPHTQVDRLIKKDVLTKQQGGAYCLTEREHELSQHFVLGSLTIQYPNAVFSHETALGFHQLGTSNAYRVSMTLPTNAYHPKNAYKIQLLTYSMSPKKIHIGVEEHNIDGIAVPITGVLRTVCDMFKFRNKIGIHIAMEALRHGLEDNFFTLGELGTFSREYGTHKMMKPYLEAMIS